MKKILGLDLGTNSIGWALVEQDFDNKEGKILGMGSRIIPMSQDILGEFGKGNSVSQTATRTAFRGTRRLYERSNLRRERLHRVLNVLDFLPKHYAADIDFEKRFGKFREEKEPKLAWIQNEDRKFSFLFQSSFNEMVADFKANGQEIKIPYDWTIYYLRKKALTNKITKEELAWLILNFNQKRGYYQLRGEEEEENKNKKVEFYSLKVVDVIPDKSYIFTLSNEMEYRYESNEDLSNWKDTEQTFLVTTYLDKDGKPKKDEKGKDKRSIILKQQDNKIVKSKKGTSSTKVEEIALTITNIKEETKEEVWYSLILENDWIYRRPSKTSLMDWKDKVREFIVTTDMNDDGTIKKDDEGNEKRNFRAPKEDDWTLVKKKTENDLENYIADKKSEKTVGSYIYEALLQNPTQKIKGKLVRTIERKFYKDELRAILEKQIALQPELFTDDLYNDCVRELYRSNEAHQLQLSKRDFVHLFLDDIIFYHRPLRSQKSNISNCSLEYRLYKINKKDEKGNPIKNVFETDENGKEIEVKEYLKAIPKSNPYYQEFRVWQWLYNLKIYTKKEDEDVTDQFIKSDEDKEKLFDFLMNEKEVDHKKILKYFFKDLKGKVQTAEIAKYRWNYVYDSEKDESKTYPMNETGYEIRRKLKDVATVPADFLTREIEQQLWHIIYSVTDKIEFERALKSFAVKYKLDEPSFVENFRNFKPFKSEYGAFSEKAIKKLLPLMRIGRYWKWENIDTKTQTRIDKLLTGEFDAEIQNRVREKAINLTNKNHFQGLQLWLAQYVVYDRHSEAADIGKWNSVEDLKTFLDEFKQHSLRNPIVEQIITETLRVVKDIWTQYGNGAKDFFNEIHVELGREMKNTADDRKRLTSVVTDNENTNQRIKLLLMELKNDANIENVRPYSPIQQEILKIYEEYALQSNEKYDEDKDIFISDPTPDDIIKISKTAQPTKTEINRYKLWLEQKYRSPYTGKVIPLTKLFTSEYEIEHVIPKSLYFDDSLSNKIICEAAVNKLKDNQLGLEFIKNHHGQKVETGFGKTVEIFSEDAYKKFVDEHYSKNRTKRNKLLLEEIPDKMIERQMNDTRYISKFVSQLLSNIVRDDKDGNNDDGINSKNLIPGNGKITTRLKQDWGLNDVWNELILPRFERMNELTSSEDFTTKNKEGHTIPAIPFELSKGFQKKRIDHRHHAMDALVIACATRDHVNLLNNQSAKSDNSRYDLQYKLRNTEKWKDKNGNLHDKFTEFKMPWNNFTDDAKNELENIVVSFKQNLRVINKATNYYEKIVNGKKIEKKQEGVNWAIRKSMHKDTVSGKVYLFNETKEMTIKKALEKINILKNVQIIVDENQRKIINKYFSNHKVDIENALKDKNLRDLKRITVFEPQSATRKLLDISFTEKFIKGSVTDTGIQKILLNHLSAKENNPEIAFSPEGIEDMNKNIISLNDNKFHQPIFKVRIYETIGNKFSVGQKGNKKDKYVEAAKGTNLFFAIYQDERGKRSFATIPLNEVIERQKQGLSSVPDKNDKDDNLLFYLSPNDLVYVPTEDELVNNSIINFENLTNEQRKRIYKFTDGSGIMANFIPANIATVLFNMNKDKQKKAFGKEMYSIQNEIGVGSQSSKNENAITKEQIKSICIKLKVDRLGNISKA